MAHLLTRLHKQPFLGCHCWEEIPQTLRNAFLQQLLQSSAPVKQSKTKERCTTSLPQSCPRKKARQASLRYLSSLNIPIFPTLCPEHCRIKISMSRRAPFMTRICWPFSWAHVTSSDLGRLVLNKPETNPNWQLLSPGIPLFPHTSPYSRKSYEITEGCFKFQGFPITTLLRFHLSVGVGPMLGPRVEMLLCSNSDSKLQIRASAQVWILGQGLQCVLQTWRGPLTGVAWHQHLIKLTFQANIIRLFAFCLKPWVWKVPKRINVKMVQVSSSIKPCFFSWMMASIYICVLGGGEGVHEHELQVLSRSQEGLQRGCRFA